MFCEVEMSRGKVSFDHQSCYTYICIQAGNLKCASTSKLSLFVRCSVTRNQGAKKLNSAVAPPLGTLTSREAQEGKDEEKRGRNKVGREDRMKM